jgi:soluble lytic murein transglycosylase-like protein
MVTGTAVGWLRLPEGSWGRYAAEIDEIANRHGVNPGLVRSVIRAESAFNPWAVSRKGAQGLMQLMPSTASSLGVRDAFNPRQNIEGGVRHLRYLLDRYPGNTTLALAAYNAGENAVDRYGGVPPYQETQQYVRKILDIQGEMPGGRDTIYRHEATDGTVTYTNLPSTQRLRIR